MWKAEKEDIDLDKVTQNDLGLRGIDEWKEVA